MKKIGIYNPYLDTKGGGEKVCLALAEVLARDANNRVTFLTHSEVDLDELAAYFNIDLSRLSVFIIQHNRMLNKLMNWLHTPIKLRGLIIDFQTLLAIRRMKLDLFINNCYQSALPNPAKAGVYMCMFPQKLPGKGITQTRTKLRHKILSALNQIILHPGHKHFFQSYNTITANSEYTRGYIKKFWEVDSQVLYPICEDMKLPGIKKEKLILNVGRFFENTLESHNKRQDFLVEAFNDLDNMHKEGWELHLAGTVARDIGALNYILDLMSAAAGKPVFFHFNASFDELRTLYNRASIYWHATGHGVKPGDYPEKQEHFGISTVEAMSTGTIPIVINTAGQKEVVTDNRNGYLWANKSELKSKTNHLAAQSDKRLEPFRSQARQTLALYDKTAFHKRVKEIFSA